MFLAYSDKMSLEELLALGVTFVGGIVGFCLITPQSRIQNSSKTATIIQGSVSDYIHDIIVKYVPKILGGFVVAFIAYGAVHYGPKIYHQFMYNPDGSPYFQASLQLMDIYKDIVIGHGQQILSNVPKLSLH